VMRVRRNESAVSQGQRAYEQLRDEIVRWELQPGALLNEVRLAERLSVSRTPLREAVQRLARDGLITITPGRGALVAQLALQDVVHLFQMREALEPYAARLCARNPDRREFGELRAAFDDQRDVFEKELPPHSDYAEYYALIKRMDTAIDEGSGNPYVRESLERLRTHLQRLRQIAKRRPPRMQQTVIEHLAICAAIHDGDETAAAQATALHINNSLHSILAEMTNDVIAHTTFATSTAADGHEQQTHRDTR
jgi:GntR family transcriptional regulator, rspAB operon transcriptional repressor